MAKFLDIHLYITSVAPVSGPYPDSSLENLMKCCQESSFFHRLQGGCVAPGARPNAQADQDGPHYRFEDAHQGRSPGLGRPLPGHQEAGHGKGEMSNITWEVSAKKFAFKRTRDNLDFQVTVFYCGNPGLADVLLQKSNKFDFSFKKEIF